MFNNNNIKDYLFPVVVSWGVGEFHGAATANSTTKKLITSAVSGAGVWSLSAESPDSPGGGWNLQRSVFVVTY